MQNRYNILQSGFITLENPLLLTPKSRESEFEFDAYILNKPLSDNENLFFYHKGVEELYEDYCKNTAAYACLEKQEAFILVALDAFSKLTFASWIALQNENPRITELHYEFIIDTLKFIQGHGRRMSIETWGLIIDKDNLFDKKMAKKFKLDEFFNASAGAYDVLEGSDVPLYNLPYKMADLLKIWLTRPMGFNDFVMTVSLIFGKRNSRKNEV